eukprot:CAMPEP_0184693072 /NCGR_PEP_ID=MMETSP0313-20130426/1370_1 /TAXON_ID=2792 /ORGANISM="Porphyridium aerugineum, Strain SAG 1380-2" /LENGTH=194 /DNA_ID=CAMNT_0027151033 /DNA_START=136 /DNA_END=720 /DNA_ORIENTATION=-
MEQRGRQDIESGQTQAFYSIPTEEIRDSDENRNSFEGKARTGDLSPYAQKIVAEAFVWLCSLIVWGAAADECTQLGGCDGFAGWQVACGILSWLFMSFILFMNYVCESGKSSRYGWFSHRFEMQMLIFPCLLWVPGVATTSSRNSEASGVAVFFAWLAFLGSFWSVLKAYFSFREEDEPDVIPSGVKVHPYIYG